MGKGFKKFDKPLNGVDASRLRWDSLPRAAQVNKPEPLPTRQKV
jgi:hypothetical protein